MISFIVAMDKKRVIGKNNQIPWHLPDDLKRFKRITMGHKVVMGRKTFESIGRPLPGRENIVLSSDPNFNCSECVIFRDKDDLINYCLKQKEEVFIIGGAKLFKIFVPYVERLYITKINEEFDGDVFFPSISWSDYTIVYQKNGVKNKENPYQYKYLIYKKIINKTE